MSDYSYLDNLTEAELDALKIQAQVDLQSCSAQVIEATLTRDNAQQALANCQQVYDQAVINQNRPPSVNGETTVDDGNPVVEVIAIDIPINIVQRTGNGDDGLGIVYDWSVPIEVRFNTNVQIYVSGEKANTNASILQTVNGAIPQFGDSLITNEVGVVIPDLFDPNIVRGADQTFVVTTGALAVDQTFAVSVSASPPDQIFSVETGPAVPDQVFGVTSIETLEVATAEAPFVVTVFAKPADQVFSVRSSAVPPDQTFAVTRGPEEPTVVHDVLVLANSWNVTVSYAVPDKIFSVELGPEPAPTPDQIFDVSIGGPDAPPIPTPHEIFNVIVGAAIPNKTFTVTSIKTHVVEAKPAPFVVTVGPDSPDQIFNVTSAARPFDQSFAVSVGPEIPTQTFEVTSIDTFAVTAYEAPKFYDVQENITPAYVVSGEGLNFAVAPTIGLYVGQTVRFNVDAPANGMRIKNVQAAGAGADPSTFGATVFNNGANNGLITATFYQPGTYYYQSEFDANVFGEINVFGTQPNAPDTTFVVTTFAEPADQIFDVTVSADLPDSTFVVKTGEVLDVTVGPAMPDQTFGVLVAAENPDQTFNVTVDQVLLQYTVANSGSGDYMISGEGLVNNLDPSLTAAVGQPIEFTMNAPGHPFWIGDSNTTGAGVSSASWADELVNNGIASGGVIRVRFNTAGVYHYNCQFHGSMHGTITVS